jgi:ferric-dicitrate binding protein FerR (iron transport regulator)
MTCGRASVALLALALIACAALAMWWWPQAAPPEPRMERLADGVEAYFRTDSKLIPAQGYPNPREIHVDGDFLIRAPEANSPLIVRSRLLVLKVTGRTSFRITAYSHEAGEQVEVLEGHIEARKSYPSNYSEPDLLVAGQMTMINKDIDLMEKETTDLAALRAWSEALETSVKQAGR